MRTVLLATGRFGAGVLASMCEAGVPPGLVLTPTARPGGRGRGVRDVPAAREGLARAVPVEQVRRRDLPGRLSGSGAPVGVVADCGWILGSSALGALPHGILGVHPSLLPAYRGASPVARAILDGVEVTGVTIFRVVAPVDAGPTAAAVEVPILPGEDRPRLEARLAALSGPLVRRVLKDLDAGTAVWTPQDDARATLAPRMEAADGRVEWSRPAAGIERLVRACAGWPWAHTTFPLRGARARLNLVRVAVVDPPGPGAPGTVVNAGGWPVVLAGSGALRIDACTPQGKREMPGDAFLRGQGGVVGAVLM